MGAEFYFDYRRGGPLPPMQNLRVIVKEQDTGRIVAEPYPVLLGWTVDWLWIEPHLGNTELQGRIMLTSGALNLRPGKHRATVTATFPGTAVIADYSIVTLQVQGGF